MERRAKIKLLVLAVLLFACLISVLALNREDRGGKLKVAFLNIGQGDAILIEAPSGNQILVDGGPGRSVLRELGKVLPFYDRSIDVVLATHPDADHIGGLPDVLSKYKVDLYIESGANHDTKLFAGLNSKIENLNQANSKKRIEKLEARKGMIVDLGSGAKLEILFPAIDPSEMESNGASIVARLVYGENEFLLTGDSPIAIENYLVNYVGPEYLESDVLKAGHHGSRTSTSAAFVSAVSPEFVVISAGKENKYGHPHQEVLDILNNFGTKILRTDLNGRIIFESNGVNLELK